MQTFSSQRLYEVLVEFGCCDICCLRFLKAYHHEEYQDIDAYLEKVRGIKIEFRFFVFMDLPFPDKMHQDRAKGGSGDMHCLSGGVPGGVVQ